MKERPILFSAPMVRAILEGRKSQTRRVIKPQPLNVLFHQGQWIQASCEREPKDIALVCPYGQPGDQLWVRETWLSLPLGGLTYRATETCANVGGQWRPSIFMPRSASRITLEVTAIRAERVQHITEADALAEGIHCDGVTPLKTQYAALWEYFLSKRGYSWFDNPWVWVVSFRRV